MKKILIIEDDIALADVLKIHFEKKGYLASVNVDATHALRWLEEIDKPDLILLDIGLPDMDGLELCKKIKSNFTTRKIPIIILTGKEGNDLTIKGTLESFADLYLHKPIEFNELLKAADHLVEKYLEEKNILRDIYRKNSKDTETNGFNSII